VADTVNHTIRAITLTGSNALVSTLAGLAGNPGSADGTGNAARFNYPAALGVDAIGNVFVADRSNSTIRKVAPAGSWRIWQAGREPPAARTARAARLASLDRTVSPWIVWATFLWPTRRTTPFARAAALQRQFR